MLLCDFGDLVREIRQLEDAGVRALHLDVMDGNFVPNMTYGMPIVEAIRRVTDLTLDVHLMIERPERYLRQFYDAGADILTIHVESVDEPQRVLGEIRELGAGSGLALNPGTPVDHVIEHLPQCDLALVMSVEAGFGGQAFQRSAIDKLRELRRVADASILLEVDGGINRETIRECAEAGAELFVAGSAVFRSDDYSAAVRELTQLAST
jgi:ribulose-phosphate 3-epimerase